VAVLLLVPQREVCYRDCDRYFLVTDCMPLLDDLLVDRNICTNATNQSLSLNVIRSSSSSSTALVLSY
jgi:hypothetical protein